MGVQQENVTDNDYYFWINRITKRNIKERVLDHLTGIFREFLKTPDPRIPRFVPKGDLNLIYISPKQDEIFVIMIPYDTILKSKICSTEIEITDFLREQDIFKQHVVGKDRVRILLRGQINLDEWDVCWIPSNHNPYFDYEDGMSQCVNCSRLFRLPYPWRLYCSSKCRNEAAIKIRQKKEMIKKKLHESELERNPKICKFCGNPIATTSRSHTKFCSGKCRVAFHRKKKISG
jgi:hypothetical protein